MAALIFPGDWSPELAFPVPFPEQRPVEFRQAEDGETTTAVARRPGELLNVLEPGPIVVRRHPVRAPANPGKDPVVASTGPAEVARICKNGPYRHPPQGRVVIGGQAFTQTESKPGPGMT